MTHLNEFNNIRMVQFFENGYLLINPLERAFGLSRTLREGSGAARSWSSWKTSQQDDRWGGAWPSACVHSVSGAFNASAPLLTWEPCLPHQLLLRQHFHRLQRKGENEWARKKKINKTDFQNVTVQFPLKCWFHEPQAVDKLQNVSTNFSHHSLLDKVAPISSSLEDLTQKYNQHTWKYVTRI